MQHLPQLIIDLALILCAAGFTTLLFRRLKQPVVLGYLLCGLMVGPNFALFPTVGDAEGIQIWAEIGVVFLLFSLGLEFSFKKLATVGGAASITGVIELVLMMGIGFLAATALGWPMMDRLFLGAILAISSTTIIFRAFEELKLKTKLFTSLVMGILIIEDLAAVLLMVLLSTTAATREIEGLDMLIALGRLLFFILLWFLLGIYLLPTLLKKLSRFLTNETMLVLALGLCLGMVVVASKTGFSAALGAFVMGSILSETSQGERIENLLVPVKHLFGAVFFVSVGMLIDPRMLIEHAGPVLLFSAIVIFGKLVFVTSGALISGRPLRQAIEAGTSMTQIGEFSFIIATLGLSLHVTSSYLYPIAVGVSVLTTFTTPFFMRSAGPLYNWLQNRLPDRWLRSIQQYSAGSSVLKSESDWQLIIKRYVRLVGSQSIIIIAVILLSHYYLVPFFNNWIAQQGLGRAVGLAVSLAAVSPFAWALMAKPISRQSYRLLWLNKRYNRGPLVTLEVVRSALGLALLSVLVWQYFPNRISLALMLVLMLIVVFVFRRRLHLFYHRIEKRFLDNLNSREDGLAKPEASLGVWDAHLSRFQIGSGSDLTYDTLHEMQLRERYGINVAFIERDNQLICVPEGTDRIFPGDKIGVIGTDEQLAEFAQHVQQSQQQVVAQAAPQIGVDKVLVDQHNQLRGVAIRDSGIRQKAKGLVIGIERNGQRMVNPPSHTVFEWGDVVWIVGDMQMLRELHHHPL